MTAEELRKHNLNCISISDGGCLHSLTFLFGTYQSPPNRAYQQDAFLSYWITGRHKIKKLVFSYYYKDGMW